jgi:predicted nucleotidyltransferase
LGLKNKKINESIIKKVAVALGELNESVVYVGGAVVSLYADDPAADDVRPTKDIDIFLEIATYGKLAQLQNDISKKGFFPAEDEEVMCRFKYEDVLVDIMAVKEVGWAPADKWFEPGLKHLEEFNIEDIKINILHVSYFIATKLSAFHDRKEEARISRHFEDIVYVLDNRLNIVQEIIESQDDVKNYLITEFRELLKKEFQEAILAHLPYNSQMERFEMLKGKLTEIINSVQPEQQNKI